MMASGTTTNATDTASIQIRRGPGMKVTGRTTLNQAKEQRSGLKAQSMSVNTKTARNKAMVLILGLTVQFTKETGSITASTE